MQGLPLDDEQHLTKVYELPDPGMWQQHFSTNSSQVGGLGDLDDRRPAFSPPDFATLPANEVGGHAGQIREPSLFVRPESPDHQTRLRGGANGALPITVVFGDAVVSQPTEGTS